jgi:hypothetical protein
VGSITGSSFGGSGRHDCLSIVNQQPSRHQRPGKRADLVLLSGDPTALPPDEIADLDVEMTIIAGEIAWPSR